jgi:hypothetical protein
LFVEDGVAESLLKEIVQRCSPELRHTACLIPLGNATDVQRMVARLRPQGVRAVGIRDADYGHAPDQGLFCLPGDACPEAVLLTNDNLARAEGLIAGVTEAARRAAPHGQGYDGSARAKRVYKALCTELEMIPSLVTDRLILAWLNAPECEAQSRLLIRDVRRSLEGVRAG